VQGTPQGDPHGGVVWCYGILVAQDIRSLIKSKTRPLFKIVETNRLQTGPLHQRHRRRDDGSDSESRDGRQAFDIQLF